MSDEDNTEDDITETESGDAASGSDDGDLDSMFEAPGGANKNPMDLGEMTSSEGAEEIAHQYDIGEPMAGDVTAIYDIPVQISAVLGRSTMQVSQLLKLGRGAVVELDRKVGEAIDIYVNNRLVARGEVVVVEDKLGVTMTEIVKSDRN